jgi:REP element-mobilizing transposase RayT
MPGFDYHGRHRVLITTCTFDREPLLDETEAADDVSAQLIATPISSDIEVTAYCVMRDHVHAMLTDLTERAHTPTMIKRWKQLTGYRYKQRTGRLLWQGHYWDRVLRAEDETLQQVRYVIRNPLIDGAKELHTYRWLGSTRWSRDDLIEIASSNEAPFWWDA